MGENNTVMLDDIVPYDIVQKTSVQPQSFGNLKLNVPNTNFGISQNFSMPFQQYIANYKSVPEQPQSRIYTPKTFNKEDRFREMYGTMGGKKELKKFNKYWNSNQRWEDYDKFASGEHNKFIQSIDNTLNSLRQQSDQTIQKAVNSYKPLETPQSSVQSIDWNNVESVQNWLNTKFNSGLTVDSMYGQNTNNAITTALQRNDLTDSERQGLINLQNSWKDRMIGSKAKLVNKQGELNSQVKGSKENPIELNNLEVIGNPKTYDVNDLYNSGRFRQHGNSRWRKIKIDGKIYETVVPIRNSTNGKYMADESYAFDPETGKIRRYEENILGKPLNWYEGSDWVDYNKQGGLINKHQQGGTMANNEQELQKAFMAFLIEDAAAQGVKIQSEEDLKAYAQQLGKEGLQAKYQEFMQRMQGGVKAKLGAKLDYIRKIKGLCAEDEELVYMKRGGRMCPVCEKKKKAMKAKEGEKLDAVKEFKCGRKIKKAEGGNVLGLKGKINEYNEPDPKNPQKVLYDDHGNSVIRENGYFIKRKELSNNKIKDDTIPKKDPRYIKIETEFNKNTRN